MKQIISALVTSLLLVSFVGFAAAMHDPESGSDVSHDDETAIGGSATSFAACVKAGNPVKESYPQQCTDENGITYEEYIDPATETREQRLKRMMNQFSAGDDISRVGFSFAEGVDKEEAQAILQKYHLQLMKVELCEGGGVASETAVVSVSGSSSGVTEEGSPAIAVVATGADLNPEVDGVETAPEVPSEIDLTGDEVIAPTDCETGDSWIKLGDEYFGEVELRGRSARGVVSKMIVQGEFDTGDSLVWAEPYADPVPLGGPDVAVLAAAGSGNKGVSESAADRMERMKRAFDRNEGIMKGAIVITFGSEVSENAAEDILRRYGLKIGTWEGISRSATVEIPKGEEKDLAVKIVSEEKDVEWAEPDYEYSVSGTKNSGDDDEPGFFSGIWGWLKGIFN